MSCQLIEAFTVETESVSQQLDRLNQAIQCLGLDQSPDKSFYMTPLSLDSSKTFSRFSDEYEENMLGMNICKGIEKFLLELDRALMGREDFRSLEMRKMEELGESKNELVLQVGSDEVELIRRNFEDLGFAGKEEFKVEVDGKKLKFVLNKEKVVLIKKEEIFCGFKNDWEDFNWKPSEHLWEDSKELVRLMEESFTDQFKWGERSEIEVGKIEVSLKVPKFKEHQIVESLEWQALEINNLKTQYQSKITLTDDYLKELNKLKDTLKSKEINLYNQKALFLRDIENLKQHKRLLEKLRDENKKYLQMMNPLKVDKKSSIQTDSKHQIEIEMKVLQQEISRLEALQHSDNSEFIQIKIDRLKNKFSNLKTLRVINASAERSNFVASKLKCFERNRTPQILKEIPLKSLNNKENYRIIKPAFETESSLEEFHAYIKLQESRLIEKEQELNQRESFITKSWISISEVSEAAQAIQSEQRNLKILRRNLEKKQKYLETEALSQINKAREFSELEKNFSKSISTVSQFISEQTLLESRLQYFFEFLDTVTFDRSLINY